MVLISDRVVVWCGLCRGNGESILIWLLWDSYLAKVERITLHVSFFEYQLYIECFFVKYQLFLAVTSNIDHENKIVKM